MNFDDLVPRFDAGEVTEAVIDELLLILHPDDATARRERKDRVMPDGEMVKYQVVALNKQAQAAEQQRQNQPESRPEAIEVPEQFQDDIPDEVYEGPDYVSEIKQRVGIIQAVRTWGKPQARIKDNRTEGVKVRCPFSDHVDHDPSAWVNTSKQTWYCGKCTIGGDVIDFYAAARHDLQPTQFHRSPEFSRIIKEMADELGITIVSTSDGGQYVEARTEDWASNQLDKDAVVAEEQRAQPEPMEITEQTEDGPVTYAEFYEPSVPASSEATEPITISSDEMLRGLELDDELDEDAIDALFDINNLPSFDWHDLDVPEGTFFHSWMEQAESELPWIPQEFFIGLGLQAIGISCSHSTTSFSYGTLTGSTLAVLIGDSATGKSIATKRLTHLIQEATGAKWDRATGMGVKHITSVASAEALLAKIKTEIVDINDPEVKKEIPTNAWYVEDELATFISRSRRQGGEHIKQRVMTFHDFCKSKDEPEVVAEDYSLTGGHRDVRDTYFTGTFLTQNDALATLAEKADLVSGFFNRMIFFMGRGRRERSILDAQSYDPDPPYVKMYERMWKDCQNRKRLIPFSDDSKRLIMNHPVRTRMGTIQKISPMFARWEHQVCRFAFLLAVNENSPLVEPQHVNAAYHFVSSYTIPCASSMVKYVKTPTKSDKDFLAERIEKWLQEQYDKKGRWPELRSLRTTRFWKEADGEVRKRALDLMQIDHTVVQVTLLDGPDGSRTYLLTPTGDFSAYYESNNKKYKYDDFYAGKRFRT